MSKLAGRPQNRKKMAEMAYQTLLLKQNILTKFTKTETSKYRLTQTLGTQDYVSYLHQTGCFGSLQPQYSSINVASFFFCFSLFQLFV